MSTIKDGGSAFPGLFIEDDYGAGYSGMSIRDYFAAKALSGMMSRKDSDGWTQSEIASDCYKYADAMIKEREREL